MYSSVSRRTFLTSSTKAAFAGIVFNEASRIVDATQTDVLASSHLPQSTSTRALAGISTRLDEFIARHMQETGAPGLTLAVANREGPLKISAYGLADTKSRLRVTPDTMFEIGSISKSFISLTLLQLREEGKLDLNKPIAEYLPWLKINSRFEPITTSHILSHTAGLPAAPLLLDALLSELWTGYAPGNRFLYSNTGYNILGFLIEAIDKRPFADSVRVRLLEPLGMTASSPLISHETRGKMAVGYEPFYEGRPFALHGTLAEAQWLEMDMAAGSIASTPADMAKYMRMLLNRGALPKGRLVSEATFNLFTKPEVKTPFRGEEASYAYGFWVSDVAGHTCLRHTGGMVAFSSSIDADITSGVGAFASVNANLHGYRPVAVTKYAIELLNSSLEGKPLPDAPPPPPPTEEVKNSADYAGTFTSRDGKKLVLVAQGSRLILAYDGQRVVLERAGRDMFIVKHPDFDRFLLGFVRDQERVTEAFHGSNWYAGLNYVGPRVFDSPEEWAGYVGHYANDSPWYGETRIVLRKGKLYSDGVEPLIPLSDAKFGIGDTEGPDWIEFGSIIDGRAMRLSFSGIIFRRAFTP
jgi:CubicO group peptidase (beta-lactamase class C family)